MPKERRGGEGGGGGREERRGGEGRGGEGRGGEGRGGEGRGGEGRGEGREEGRGEERERDWKSDRGQPHKLASFVSRLHCPAFLEKHGQGAWAPENLNPSNPCSSGCFQQFSDCHKHSWLLINI